MSYANSKDIDQPAQVPAHLRSPISAIVVRCPGCYIVFPHHTTKKECFLMAWDLYIGSSRVLFGVIRKIEECVGPKVLVPIDYPIIRHIKRHSDV